MEDRTVTVVGSILNYAGINQLVHDNLQQNLKKKNNRQTTLALYFNHN